MQYAIRWANGGDLGRLQRFFATAYGPTSVFTAERFLRWFLGTPEGGFRSVIATGDGSEIVAHYGGTSATLDTPEGPLPLVWGVSAHTLDAHRGEGLGTRLIEPFLADDGVFGVIGFTPRTLGFYDRLGFHTFEHQRFVRHARALTPELSELATHYEVDPAQVHSRLPVRSVSGPAPADVAVCDEPDVASRGLAPDGTGWQRGAAELAWRFFTAPAPTYRVIRHRNGGLLTYRLRILRPTAHTCLTIVDLAGPATAAPSLLQAALVAGRDHGCVFVDFACFGDRFDAPLAERGFERLADDDFALLPQLTNPMGPRPNHEYVGLFSASHPQVIEALQWSNTYFTRADSDRDRASTVADLEG